MLPVASTGQVRRRIESSVARQGRRGEEATSFQADPG